MSRLICNSEPLNHGLQAIIAGFIQCAKPRPVILSFSLIYFVCIYKPLIVRRWGRDIVVEAKLRVETEKKG